MSKVSIITTTYRHEKFIAETIDSILSQSFTDWELFVGDDSPDDATWSIIQKYVERYPNKIHAWRHIPNKGIVENMNFLISKVTNESEYIAFLEGDDLYTSDNLEKKLDIFHRYPDVAMVYNNLDFIDSYGRIFLTNFFQNNEKVITNNILNLEYFINGKNFYLSYSTLMVRNTVFKTIKINNPTNDKLFIVSDWLFFGEVASKLKIYGLVDSLTLYRKHTTNFSSNYIRLIQDQIIGIQYFIEKNPRLNLKFRLYYLLMRLNWLTFNRNASFRFGILSFRYSLIRNFISRIGILFFYFLPKSINQIMVNKILKNKL